MRANVVMGCSLLSAVLLHPRPVWAHTLYMSSVNLDGILQPCFGDNLRGERKLKTDLDRVAKDLLVVCAGVEYGKIKLMCWLLDAFFFFFFHCFL